ncbi:MAG: hypothetical protein JWQ16_326 [Novosphingobium sp.]|nr:hypothetical protein [Novosphingobium sp.]
MDNAIGRALRNPWVQLAILLIIALVLRCDTFGDPNLDDDDTFYYTVGIAMHHGALPYVDVWDRKPFGLFAIYYLIAGISPAPLAYQLVTTVFAAATAAVIAALGARWTRPLGGLLAGICYLLWLSPTQGFGGQTPLFYNLFVAGAALLLVRALPQLQRGAIGRDAVMAMLLAGCAITIKTTAMFEAAFFGLFAVWTVARSGRGRGVTLRHAALYGAIGAAPTLLIGAAYWLGGHGPEFWHAMVTSNLTKPAPDFFSMGIRALIMFSYLAPLLILAIFGLMDEESRSRRFVALWLLAAFVGLVSVPRFYMHYALPLLVPLCVAAIPFLARKGIGIAATAIVAGLALWLTPPWQFEATAQSKLAIDRLAAATRAHLGGGPLFVYDGPPELYALTGQGLITPLTFYAHLSDLAEKDVSHLSTLGEVRRVLALRPGVVVMTKPLRSGPVNMETYTAVQEYIARNCRLVAAGTAHERMLSYRVEVWGDCRR